jgi:Tol biopolymer transport system component
MRTLLGVALAGLAAVAAAGSSSAAAERGWVLFWSDRGWPGPSIWAMRPDGSGVRLLLHAGQNAKRPVLSPDGSLVAFDAASPGEAPMSDSDVQVVRRDGTGRRTVAGTRAAELDAQWSPRGSLLSYSRQPSLADWRRSWIWVVRQDGTGARRLARGQFARWAPDGRRLVLDAPTAESDGDLFVVAVDGRRLRRLTRTPELEQPAGWSRDGRIVFTRFAADGSGRSTVYVVGIDGTGLRRLTDGRHADEAAAWSPDGRRVLFTSDRTGRRQVLVMSADGSRPRNLSRSRFDDEATSWR